MRLVLLCMVICLSTLHAEGLPGEVPANAVAASALDPKHGVGSWIWDSQTHDRQECHLWRVFDIPAGAAVTRAQLRITADNFYTVSLDGQEVGRGSDWHCLIQYDLAPLLQPGTHVLAVDAFNDFAAGGVVLGLRIELGDGRTIEIGSDESWRVVPAEQRNWETQTHASAMWRPATVLSPFTGMHWPMSNAEIFTAPPLRVAVIPFWQRAWFQIAMASVCFAAIAGCLLLASRLWLQAQAQSVVRRERARIARDIHDDLTAGLTQLVLQGETTRNDLPGSSEARASVGQICDRLRGLLRSMNETVWLINSQRDTLRDFASYMCKYAEAMLQGTSIRCRFDLDEEMPPTPCDVGFRRNLFLATKEAIHNVIKHSQATEIFLRIHRAGNLVVVRVEDNGRGFDPQSADPQRNGMANMRHRAMEAGGVCRIISRPGAGCRIEFSAPLRTPRRAYMRWLIQSLPDNSCCTQPPPAERFIDPKDISRP